VAGPLSFSGGSMNPFAKKGKGGKKIAGGKKMGGKC
jgi:hypothetical protein